VDELFVVLSSSGISGISKKCAYIYYSHEDTPTLEALAGDVINPAYSHKDHVFY
jgi:hypothetical protein